MSNFVRHAGRGFLGSIARHEVNTSPVQRAGDSFGKKRPVVAGVVPGQPPFIARRKPELFHEIYCSTRLLGVDDDFAFLVNFHAAKGPEHGIGKPWGIAERMAQRLADGHTELFQFLAGREMLFPGIGELVVPYLLKDILAIRVRTTPKEVRHTTGDSINRHRISDERIKFVTPEFSNELIVVFQTTGVEMRVVIEQLQDIGPLTAFNRRRGPGEQIVGVDVLEGDLHPSLFAELSRLLISDHIGGRDKATPFEDVQRPGLSQGWRLPSHKLRTGGCRQGHTRAEEGTPRQPPCWVSSGLLWRSLWHTSAPSCCTAQGAPGLLPSRHDRVSQWGSYCRARRGRSQERVQRETGGRAAGTEHSLT